MTLTPSQLHASQTIDKSIAVIASAGSGKTRVLIERYKNLIAAGIPPQSILAFTFTEKAALEIKERLTSQKTLNFLQASNLPLGTIHAYCLRFLKKHGPLLGLNSSFRVMGEAEALVEQRRFIRKTLTHKLALNQPLVLELIDSFGFQKTENLLDQLMGLCEVKSIKEKTPLLTFVDEIKSLWQREKISLSKLDFDDLESITLQILDKFNEVRESEVALYKHLLIDEFQDTNPQQGRLFSHLFNPSKNILFIVGDPKQSIYRFRKADVSLFNHFADLIKKNGGEVVSLNETFRIPAEIATSVNKLFHPLFKGGPISFEPILSQSPTSGKINFIIHSNEKTPAEVLRLAEATYISSEINRIHQAGCDYSEIALLFRSGSFIPFFQRHLESQGIPTITDRHESLLELPIIKDIHLFLRFLSDEEKSPYHLAGILRSRFMNFSEEDILWLLTKSQLNLKDLRPFPLQVFPGASQWNQLLTFFKGLKEPQDNCYQYAKSLVEGLIDKFQVNLGRKERNILEQWLFLIHELKDSCDNSVATLVTLLEDMATSPKSPQALTLHTHDEGVRLGTIHGSKGLEFTHVFLPQLHARTTNWSQDFYFDPEEGLALKKEEEIRGLKPALEESPFFLKLKMKEEQEDREEAKRVLYVAFTRAKETLTLFLKPSKKKAPALDETDSWNDWLHLFLKEEIAQAIRIQEDIPILNSDQPNRRTSSVIGSLIEGKMNFFPQPSRETPLLKYQNQEESLLKKLALSLDWKRPFQLDDLINRVFLAEGIKDPTGEEKHKIYTQIAKVLAHKPVQDLLQEEGEVIQDMPLLLPWEKRYLAMDIHWALQNSNKIVILEFETERLSAGDESKRHAWLALAAQHLGPHVQVCTGILYLNQPHLDLTLWDSPSSKNF